MIPNSAAAVKGGPDLEMFSLQRLQPRVQSQERLRLCAGRRKAMQPTAVTEFATDLEQLQGTWVCVSGRRQAEFVISGYLFAFRFQDGDTYLGTFWLGPEAQPKAMDMRLDEGPARHRGKIARCIYELSGDTLRWCPAEPGSEERLTSFPPIVDSRYLCMVFRRESV
jgi:uncharacterized protein (TIGR03067 family)